jgi:hypothetical protein
LALGKALIGVDPDSLRVADEHAEHLFSLPIGAM